MNPKLPFQCSCLADSYKLQPQKPLQFGFPGKALHWPLATAFALTPASLELAEACSCGFRNSPDTNGSWGWTLVVIQWQRNYTATICNIPFISFYTPWCGSIAFPKEQPKCGILESIQLYAPLGFHFSVDLCVNLHGMDPLTQCTGCQRDVWPKGKARPNLEVRMARCKLQRITGNALPKPTELLAPTSEWNWSPWWTSRSSAELCLWCCPWEIARK